MLHLATPARHLSSCPDVTHHEQSAAAPVPMAARVLRGQLEDPDMDAPEGPEVTISVLGPLQVLVLGREAPLTSRRQRALLALFALNPNVNLSPERLADQLWEGAPPPGALVTLRSYIYYIRKVLAAAPAQASKGDDAGVAAVLTTGSGYRLQIDPEAIDYVRFRRLVAEGHRHARAGEGLEALRSFDEALRLWRGCPLSEIAALDGAVPLISELGELRTSALEGRLRVMVALGQHREAVPMLESLIAEEPLREGPYELLMLALYRSGRSAAALEVHQRFRTLMREELGIDPSSEFNQLVSDILNRAPALDLQGVSTVLPSSGPSSGVAPEVAPVPNDGEGSMLAALRSLLGDNVGAPVTRETVVDLVTTLHGLTLRASELLDRFEDLAPVAEPGVRSGALRGAIATDLAALVPYVAPVAGAVAAS